MSDRELAFPAYGPARGGDELPDVLRRGDEERYVGEHPEATWPPPQSTQLGAAR